MINFNLVDMAGPDKVLFQEAQTVFKEKLVLDPGTGNIRQGDLMLVRLNFSIEDAKLMNIAKNETITLVWGANNHMVTCQKGISTYDPDSIMAMAQADKLYESLLKSIKNAGLEFSFIRGTSGVLSPSISKVMIAYDDFLLSHSFDLFKSHGDSQRFEKRFYDELDHHKPIWCKAGVFLSYSQREFNLNGEERTVID